MSVYLHRLKAESSSNKMAAEGGVDFANYAARMIAKKEQSLKEAGRDDELKLWKQKIAKAKEEAAASNSMRNMIVLYFVVVLLAWYSHEWKAWVEPKVAHHDRGLEYDRFGMVPSRAFPAAGKGSSKLELISAGMRKKFGVVSVYSVGLYVDSKVQQSMISKRSLSELTAPVNGVSLGILLDFEREVGKDKVVNAIVEVLASKNNKKSYKVALKEFQSILLSQMGGSMKKKDKIEFTYRKKDQLCISVKAKSPECVENDELRKRLVNVYAGEESVVPELQAVLFTKYL